jgi:hypothetical protein
MLAVPIHPWQVGAYTPAEIEGVNDYLRALENMHTQALEDW